MTDSQALPHWEQVMAEIAAFPATIRTLPVTRPVDPQRLRERIAVEYGFSLGVPLDKLTEQVIALLRDGLVHITHPRYFGLFNPSVRDASVVGDTLAALYNPQLAAWSHAPVVQELERATLRKLAAVLGLDPDTTSGTFTTGGAEANLSAVLAALAHLCPEAAEGGIAALKRRPAIYVSGESHHSFLKIARMTGLGTDAIREIPVTERFTMDTSALDAAMTRDSEAGWMPFFVVGTAGTTSAGMVDPLPDMADIAARYGAWFHADAAWGGAAAFSQRLKPLLGGIKRADSVTWDAHKWLSVPMGAGMVFSKHPEAMARAFGVHTTYMPPAQGAITADPYSTTAQWSRRAIGLKVFCALAELGVSGYAKLIKHQTDMGDLLHERLTAKGWIVVNDTPLPLVCFTHRDVREGRITTRAMLDFIYARGRVWISDVVLGGKERVFRACITSYQTNAEDVEALVDEMELARTAAT